MNESNESMVEELLSRAIEEALAGREPDPLELCAGDAAQAERLREAMQQALRLVPELAEGKRPERLGPYLVVGELGRGGMAQVLLGRHEELGLERAIKVLPRPHSFVDEHRERFRREARAMARVQHPCVVPIHEVGEQDGVPYAAMELVPGGSLEDFLASVRDRDVATARRAGEERLPGEGSYERRIARLFAGCAEALQAIHEAGIVHRDLKPANLLLGRDGRLLVADFGLALQEDLASLTQSGAIVGTRRYLAPELTREPAEASPQSDLFSLGATMYEALAFRPPFSAPTEDGLLRRIREAEPRPLRGWNPNVGRGLAAVVAKALEKRPAQRYASAQALAEDLAAVARGEAPQSGSRSPLRPLARRAWFHRRPAGLGLVLLVALAVTGVLAWQARAARLHDELVRLFHRAEIRFVSDMRSKDPLVLESRRGALEIYLQCAGIRPDHPLVWLRIAELARRQGDEELLSQARSELERLGERGPLAQWLGVGPGEGPVWRIDMLIEENVWLQRELPGWAPHDVLWLAHSMWNRQAHTERGSAKWTEARIATFELLESPALSRDEFLVPEHLRAVWFHTDAFLPPEDRTIPYPQLSVRTALRIYDELLKELPDDPVLQHNTAYLIKDAIGNQIQLDAEEEATRLRFWEALGHFRDRHERLDSPSSAAELFQMLMYRFYCKFAGLEAVEEALRFYDERAAAGGMDVDSASPSRAQGLVLTGRYRDAYRVLRERPIQHPELLGAFHSVLKIAQVFRETHGVEPDLERLEAELETLWDELDEADRAASDALLREL